MVEERQGELALITPASRANYRQLVALLAAACWPEFMLHDPVDDEYCGDLFERFAEYQFGFLDIETGQAAALGNSLPIYWDTCLTRLPERGWDWAFERAVRDHQAGRQANLQCAIQIAIDPAYRRRGLSTRIVLPMRAVGQSPGFTRLVAPVRPSQEAAYPLVEIDRYVRWQAAGVLPFDAWLRDHARAGAKTIKVRHESMNISGSVDE